MTMDFVLLEPDASSGGCMPFKALRQKNNFMPLLCKSRGKASELGRKIVMRKKDPHLDPFIKLTGKEETQQKPADTAEEASEVFFARRSLLA